MPKEPGCGRPGRGAHRSRRGPCCTATSRPSWSRARGRTRSPWPTGGRPTSSRIDAQALLRRTLVAEAVERARGLKVNGAGSGHFEYRLAWPEGSLSPTSPRPRSWSRPRPSSSTARTAKDAREMSGDYMRGRGTLDPSRNPNAYPMTDETRFPSAVTVRVNGVLAGRHELPDDPADHRGILSWHAQLKDKKLSEAGSYGYLLEVPIPRAALEKARGRRRIADPPGGGRGAAGRSGHLRGALRALPARPDGGLRPQAVISVSPADRRRTRARGTRTSRSPRGAPCPPCPGRPCRRTRR